MAGLKSRLNLISMLEKLQKLANNLNGLDINKIIDESIMETSEKILNHNRMALLQGKATDGKELGRYKWKSYADFKADHVASYHAPYGTYNFELYGDFQDEMFVQPTLYGVEISSKDSKTPYLEGLAGGGERVFGLTDEDKEYYSNKDLKPVLQKKLREKIKV
jgi:hypothetical protein